MQQHSEFYTFAVHFWWLLFPVGWAIAGLAGAWMRHQQALKALDLLSAYAQQGKEPPAELLAALKSGKPNGRARNPSHGYIAGGISIAAIALAFLVLIADGAAGRDYAGLLFVVVVMAGISAALFVRAWLAARDRNSLPPS